jgi:hypothetical protein
VSSISVCAVYIYIYAYSLCFFLVALVGNVDIPLVDIPIPTPITAFIPGIIFIGPGISFSTGIDYKIALKGEILAGMTCTWSQISATFYLVPPLTRSSFDEDSLSPTCVPEFDAAATLTASITPYLKTNIAFNIKALQGLTDKIGGKFGLTVKTGCELAASVSTAKTECKNPGEVKLSAAVTLAVSLDASALGFSAPPFNLWKPDPFLLGDNCNR